MKRNELGQFIEGQPKGEKHPRWMGGHTGKNYYKKIRMATLEVLGGICCNCGFSDERALQIDHINGDGWKDKKIMGANRIKFYKVVLESFLNKENKYQLLCANCNWIKKSIQNETRRY